MTLEADWNDKLRELADAQDDYERAGDGAATVERGTAGPCPCPWRPTSPTLWRDPGTPMRERKRLIRLLVTDVTLLKDAEHITVHVRLSGRSDPHPRASPGRAGPGSCTRRRRRTIALIDELLEDHPFDEAVQILNERGLTGGWGKPFTVSSVRELCQLRQIPSLRTRLQARGMLTIDEIADQFGVTRQTVKKWQARGHITGRRIDGRREHLYHPGQSRPPDGRSTRWRRANETVTPPRHNGHTSGLVGISVTTSQGGAV